MAMKCKTLMKPKVRFSEHSESADDSDTCIGPFHGPKIKSVITLDKPVRIINGDNKADLLESCKKTVSEELMNNPPMIKTSVRPLKTCTSAPCLTEMSQKILTSKPTQVELAKSSKQMPIKTTIAQKKNSGAVNKHVSSTKNYVECNKENVSQRSLRSKDQKEKIKLKLLASDKSKTVENKYKPNPGQKSKQQAVTESSTVSQLKATNLASARDLLSKVKLPIVTTKPQPKPTTTTKTLRTKSHARSEMAKNISGTKPNVYIGPGISRNRTRSLSSVSEKIQSKPNTNVGNKLDRPEYNSIMFTIKKLREVKKEKIAVDIDSLPTNYRNLCMKKISSALDFSPGESIFHDLIDLSISENELPLRMMRSKDPAPRLKDLEPRLSDFFIPQYGNEYAEAVKIRPKNPQIIDNFSAFKISDRIFSWTTSLNET